MSAPLFWNESFGKVTRIGGTHPLKKEALDRAFRGVLLLLLALYLYALYLKGELHYFLAPWMTPYTLFSVIVLAVLSAFMIAEAFMIIQGERKTGYVCHTHSTRAMRYQFYIAFLIPVLLVYFTPTVTLNAETASKRGMSLSLSPSMPRIQTETLVREAQQQIDALPVDPPQPEKEVSLTDQRTAQEKLSTDQKTLSSGENKSSTHQDSASVESSLEDLFPADDPLYADFAKFAARLYQEPVIYANPSLFMEIFTAIDLYLEPFMGKTIELSGFVYRQDDFPSDQFVVARFGVTCCTADALPYGVMVTLPNAKDYPNDTWVKVKGTISKTMYQGEDIILVDVKKIQKIPEPKSPYVYPNARFVDADLAPEEESYNVP